MVYLLAAMTGAVAAVFIHDWGRGYRGRALRKAGPLLLRVGGGPWAARGPLFGAAVMLLALGYSSWTAQGNEQQLVFFAAFLFTGALLTGFRSVGRLEIHQHGLILPTTLAFLPWHEIRYGKWQVPGRLLIQLAHMNLTIETGPLAADACSELLAAHIDLRDPLGQRLVSRLKTDASPATSDDRPPGLELRQWQFTLRTLLLLTLTSATAASWYGVNYHVYAQRQTAWQRLQPLNPQMHQIDKLLFSAIYALDFSPPASPATDDDMDAVAEQADLWMLSLNDCPITDAGLLRLAGLPRLGDLRLARTKVTDEGVARFRERRRELGLREVSILR